MDIRFGAYWKASPLTLSEYIETLKAFLSDISSLHDAMTPLWHAGTNAHDAVALGTHLESLVSVACERAWNSKAPKSTFSELSIDGKPTLNAHSETGYLMVMNNGPRNADSPRVTVSAMAGATSPYLSNAVVITCHDSEKSGLLEYSMAKQVMRSIVDHWLPELAKATTAEFNAVTRESGTFGSIDWMTYFANPAVADALPPGVEHHPFGPGGVLIVTAPTMPSPDDPAADLARDIAQRLRERGLMPT